MNLCNTIGLIPAAGKGLRLGLPYPKELYPIIRDNRYKPVAQFVVDNMVASFIEHIVFVINGSKHQLIDYFGDGHRFNCNFSYVVQETRSEHGSTSPGLAHALDAAYHLTKDKIVFFGMADTIMQPRQVFNNLYEVMQTTEDIVFGLFTTDHPEKFGMVEYQENGKVIRIIDKPAQTKLSEMWGCIIWGPAFSDFLHTCVMKKNLSDFAMIMNQAIISGIPARAVHFQDGSYIDLGTYDEIIEMDRRLRQD
jgi:glucose-1-phosphate thymidylyltransferase